MNLLEENEIENENDIYFGQYQLSEIDWFLFDHSIVC